MIQGSIPEKIVIVAGKQRQVESVWDEAGLSEAADIETVTPAFPVEAGNAKVMETARRWAKGYDNNPVTEDERDNKPFGDIRIVTLEVRREGGRAWKVVTPDNYYFDMREDVLMDTLIQEGCKPGGILKGKFVFGRVGSQMKIIRVGSRLHKALVESGQRSKKKVVNPTDFEVGGVYANKAGKVFAFLGWYATIDVSFTRSYTSGYNYSRTFVDIGKFTKHKKVMLWVEIGALDTYAELPVDEDVETPVKKTFQSVVDEKFKQGQYYYMVLKKSITVIEKVGTVDLGKDPLEKIHGVANDGIERQMKDRTRSHHSESGILSSFMHLACAAPVGEDPRWPKQYSDLFGAEVPTQWRSDGKSV